METVRSDEQVKPTRPTTLEANVHSTAVVVNREDCVIEDRLDPRFDLLVDRSRQLPPRNAQEALPQRTANVGRPQLGANGTLGIDETNTVDGVAALLEHGEQTHPLGDVEAESPEVEHVAASP